jgi:ubiquinone/menaquinone biosynthesis C-methylase UbiE
VVELEPGMRVLDVGCGPGRHAHALAERGIETHGVDISQRFVDLAVERAPAGATFERMDARQMPFDGEFDAVICLCQGAFGLMTADGHDETVLGGMSRALRPGGRLALSAFSSYFVMKHWEGAVFDAATGVNHEHTEIRNEQGEAIETDLWTGCYTPRELRLLCNANGLAVDSIASVEPGAYGTDAPTTDSAEFLVIASRGPGS